MTSLRTIRGFAFDLDGTIWAGPRLLPGATELVTDLKANGVPVVFATNSSQKGARTVAATLSRLGLAAGPLDVVTALDLTAGEVRERLGAVPALVLGSADLVDSMAGVGHEPLPMERWEEARAVVVGCDPAIDYGRLRAASRAAAAGASLFAVNLDPRFPVADGFDPGGGAIVAAVAAAAGVRPIVVGKPGPKLFHEAVARLSLPAAAVAMVGDSHDADVVGGRAAGMFTVWLSTADDPPPAVAPDLVVADLIELRRLWRETGGPRRGRPDE